MVAPITNKPSLKKFAWALMRQPLPAAALHPVRFGRTTSRERRGNAIASCRFRNRVGRRFAPEELAHPRIVAGVAQDLRVAFGNDALDALVEHDDPVGHGVDA